MDDEKIRIKLIQKRNEKLQAILGQVADIIPKDDLLLCAAIDIEYLLSKMIDNGQ